MAASAASRRGSLRLGTNPAAGTGDVSSDAVQIGSPGLTAASPKALLGNRVHWTHLFPSALPWGLWVTGSLRCTSGSVLSPFLRSGQNTLVHWSVPFQQLLLTHVSKTKRRVRERASADSPPVSPSEPSSETSAGFPAGASLCLFHRSFCFPDYRIPHSRGFVNRVYKFSGMFL